MEKIEKALIMINSLLGRKSKKATLKEIQRLCGIFNFFGRCIIPGRAFTRRFYALTASAEQKLKPHHHIKLKKENRLDLQTWEIFSITTGSIFKDFADFSKVWNSNDLDFYTDASRSHHRGCGGYFQRSWFSRKWSKDFIKNYNPSIAYLELYAVTVGVALWLKDLTCKNRTIAIFCDNKSVVNMINNSTSSCEYCMILIRFIVLMAMTNNIRITAKYVPTKDNEISDSLSRLQMERFKRLTKNKNFDVNLARNSRLPLANPKNLEDMKKSAAQKAKPEMSISQERFELSTAPCMV